MKLIAALRRAWAPLSALVLVFVFVLSCVPKPINDLRVLSTTKMIAPPLESLVGGALERRHREGELVWKVSMAGDSHWVREIERFQMNSYAIVRLCNEKGVEVFHEGPYVGEVPLFSNWEGLTRKVPQKRTLIYDIYVPEEGPLISNPGLTIGRHPRPPGPLEICIRLGGGNMAGAYGRSNEVRVVLPPADSLTRPR